MPVQSPAAGPSALYGDTRYGFCSCGCDERTNWRADGSRSQFLPGHDSKLKSRLLRLAREGDADAVEALRSRGWEHFLTAGGGRRTGTRRSRGRKFGIELEVVGIGTQEAARVIRAAGIECVAEGYNHYTRSHWKVVYDASISGPGGSCEVVSPPLRGRAGFQALETVMKALRDAGATVNRSCGTHVHIDANDLQGPQVANAVRFYVDRQSNVFDAVTAPSRRNTRWCAHWSSRELQRLAEVLAHSGTRRGSRGAGALNGWDRYRSINVVSYAKYGTLEFRQHQGTLNYSKLERWIKVAMAVVEKAKSDDLDAIDTTLVGTFSGLGMTAEDATWFVDRARGFGTLGSFDAEDLAEMAA